MAMIQSGASSGYRVGVARSMPGWLQVLLPLYSTATHTSSARTYTQQTQGATPTPSTKSTPPRTSPSSCASLDRGRRFVVGAFGRFLPCTHASHDPPCQPQHCQQALIDRAQEARWFHAVSSRGLGPQLLGSFEGGRIEEYIHGRVGRSPYRRLCSALVRSGLCLSRAVSHCNQPTAQRNRH